MCADDEALTSIFNPAMIVHWRATHLRRPIPPGHLHGLNTPISRNSRGVAYRFKGVLLRNARAPCCSVEGWRQSPGLGPASALAGPSWWRSQGRVAPQSLLSAGMSSFIRIFCAAADSTCMRSVRSAFPEQAPYMGGAWARHPEPRIPAPDCSLSMLKSRRLLRESREEAAI